MRAEADWLATFAEREAVYLAEQAVFRSAVAARIAAEHGGDLTPAVAPVVLSPAVDIEAPPGRIWSRLLGLAHSLGWAARLTASLAAHPTKGRLEVVTLRFRRHDERGFAAWWNGAYECGWFNGPDGMERLAGQAMPTAPDERGRCIACGVEYRLTGKGMTWKHRAGDGATCPGSGAAPVLRRVVEGVTKIRGVSDALEGIRSSTT